MPTSGSMAPAAGAARGSDVTKNLRRFLVGHRDSFAARGLLPASGALRPLSRGMSLWADFPSLAPIDDGPHRRIAGEPFGVVDVLGASKTAVDRQHPVSTCRVFRPRRLFCFHQFGDVERSLMRPGNVHSAEDWRTVLAPVVARYRNRGRRRTFRADAAFAMSEIYFSGLLGAEFSNDGC